LAAVTSDPTGPDEVIVVDNASTDATRSIVAEFDVGCIALEENVGFAAACHTGASAAHGSTLVFLGHDSVPEHGWLVPLIDALGEDRVGAAMATLVDADDPQTYNTSGGHLNYVGLAWISGMGQPIPADEPPIVDVAFPSGSAMAIHVDTWEAFGGFRPELFMYLEDTDLGWRLRLAGLRVVRSSRSRVRHEYDFSRSASKMFYLERNRWILLGTNYRRTTLVALLPALATAELGTCFVAARDGWLPLKLRAVISAIVGWSSWHTQRSLTEANRRISDADMLATMETGVSTVSQVAPPRGSGLVDRFLASYLRLVLPLLRLTRGGGRPLSGSARVERHRL
ncbi:glycosyltransferase family 2 protein, partial [Actinomycetota bacterium]